jgi:hypothetical protein
VSRYLHRDFGPYPQRQRAFACLGQSAGARIQPEAIGQRGQTIDLGNRDAALLDSVEQAGQRTKAETVRRAEAISVQFVGLRSGMGAMQVVAGQAQRIGHHQALGPWVADPLRQLVRPLNDVFGHNAQRLHRFVGPIGRLFRIAHDGSRQIAGVEPQPGGLAEAGDGEMQRVGRALHRAGPGGGVGRFGAIRPLLHRRDPPEHEMRPDDARCSLLGREPGDLGKIAGGLVEVPLAEGDRACGVEAHRGRHTARCRKCRSRVWRRAHRQHRSLLRRIEAGRLGVRAFLVGVCEPLRRLPAWNEPRRCGDEVTDLPGEGVGRRGTQRLGAVVQQLPRRAEEAGPSGDGAQQAGQRTSRESGAFPHCADTL